MQSRHPTVRDTAANYVHDGSFEHSVGGGLLGDHARGTGTGHSGPAGGPTPAQL